MKNKSMGAFALIAMLMALGIMAILQLRGGKVGGEATRAGAAIAAGDRAIAAMIPACPETGNACDGPQWASLTATILRKHGLVAGGCLVCREEGTLRVAVLHAEQIEYEWEQEIASGLVRARRPVGALASDPASAAAGTD